MGINPFNHTKHHLSQKIFLTKDSEEKAAAPSIGDALVQADNTSLILFANGDIWVKA